MKQLRRPGTERTNIVLDTKLVERVKRLARAGVYDGLLFHRVIDGFVDQTGNPDNHDGGHAVFPSTSHHMRKPPHGRKRGRGLLRLDITRKKAR